MLLMYIAGIAMYVIGVVAFSVVMMKKAQNEPVDEEVRDPNGNGELTGFLLAIGLMLCPVVNLLMGTLALGLATNEKF